MNRLRLRPTGLWILFGPVLGCMWLAAVNYTNNLVYAVLYLVAGLTFISLFHTWRNLAHVTVEHVRIRPAHAGQEIELEIFLRNAGRRPAYDLTFLRLENSAIGWRRPHARGRRAVTTRVSRPLPLSRPGRAQFVSVRADLGLPSHGARSDLLRLSRNARPRRVAGDSARR
jgi:hypothetical protein